MKTVNNGTVLRTIWKNARDTSDLDGCEMGNHGMETSNTYNDRLDMAIFEVNNTEKATRIR